MILIIWTISALLTGLAATYGIREATLDLKALHEANGTRKIARQRLLAQMLRASIGWLWFVIGLLLWAQGINVALTPLVAVLLWGNVGTTIIALSDVYVGRSVRRSHARAAVAKPEAARED